MQRVARDLLDSTLDAWFSYLASWQPPGHSELPAADCCASSPIVAVVGLESAPHDVVHELVREVHGVLRLLRASLEELPSPLGANAAEILVLDALCERAPAIRDVVDQCVEPALEAYLRSECERGLASLNLL